VRGPFGALWNSRLLGTYLRVRVAVLAAAVLAASGAAVVGIGGVWGLLAFLALVATACLARGSVSVVR
jgi:hypothetical protein